MPYSVCKFTPMMTIALVIGLARLLIGPAFLSLVILTAHLAHSVHVCCDKTNFVSDCDLCLALKSSRRCDTDEGTTAATKNKLFPSSCCYRFIQVGHQDWLQWSRWSFKACCWIKATSEKILGSCLVRWCLHMPLLAAFVLCKYFIYSSKYTVPCIYTGT